MTVLATRRRRLLSLVAIAVAVVIALGYSSGGDRESQSALQRDRLLAQVGQNPCGEPLVVHFAAPTARELRLRANLFKTLETSSVLDLRTIELSDDLYSGTSGRSGSLPIPAC